MDQETTIPPTKDDVLAILKAHRDLGPEFDSHLADQIMELWPTSSRRDSRVRPNREVFRPARKHVSVIPILALSIPLLAIAGHFAQDTGVFAVLGLDAVALLTANFRS